MTAQGRIRHLGDWRTTWSTTSTWVQGPDRRDQKLTSKDASWLDRIDRRHHHHRRQEVVYPINQEVVTVRGIIPASTTGINSTTCRRADTQPVEALVRRSRRSIQRCRPCTCAQGAVGPSRTTSDRGDSLDHNGGTTISTSCRPPDVHAGPGDPTHDGAAETWLTFRCIVVPVAIVAVLLSTTAGDRAGW